MTDRELHNEIQAAKKETHAVVLAHYYQLPEIQDAADHVGDSFALSKLAATLPHPRIVFCGVDFMAESAKLLGPDKTVLLPVQGACCPMADMATPEEVMRLKRQHPDAAVVSYVNSTTAVKAQSHICCTSANAIPIIRSLPHKQIIFVPDKNLGSHAASHIPEKEFILYDGHCPPHDEVTASDVSRARERWPEAPLLVHPECRPEVREAADFIGSTAQIIRFTQDADHRSFIIGTEEGILHPLTKQNPGKHYHMLRDHFSCENMKKTTLAALHQSLTNNTHEVVLPPDVMERARKPLERMLEVAMQAR